MKFISLILLGLIAGCDLFGVRDAQPPDQPRADYQQAVTPEILISNLINSIKDKSTENYMASFDSPSFTNREFKFSASSSASSQFPSLSDNWGVSNEEQYFNKLPRPPLNHEPY